MTGSQHGSPWVFVALVFALALPFWALGAVTGIELFPGLPVSTLMAVCPVTAAVILVHRECGTVGVIALLSRSFDYRRIRGPWYSPILLLMPGVMLLGYALMRLDGTPMPSPVLPVLLALVMFVVFLVSGIAEELGWSGYALEPLRDRRGALTAALVLGVNYGSHYDPRVVAPVTVVVAVLVTVRSSRLGARTAT